MLWMRTLSKPMIPRTSEQLRIEESLTSIGGRNCDQRSQTNVEATYFFLQAGRVHWSS